MTLPEPESDLNETLSRLLGVVTRRRWWVLTTASGTALATILVLSQVPNRYSSAATLLVAQQRVPERYVVPTTTTTIREALVGMTQEVLSRTRLLGIIEELGLYGREKKRLAPEQVIELMRGNIDIQPLEEGKPANRDVSAFTVAFTSDSPLVAQQVTSRLTSLFIEENLRTREDQAAVTTKFLQEQLEAAQTKLAEQEQRVRDFKMQHLGELPEQQQGNLTILAGLQAQLQNTVASLNRAEQQRVYLTTLLDGYRSLADRAALLPDASPAPSGSAGSRVATPVEAARSELARLQSERAKLMVAYTPQHPDVMKVDLEIAKTEALIERLSNSPPAPVTEKIQARTMPTPPGATESAVAQVTSQLEANRLEIENLSRDQKQLKASIAEYQNRLNQTPVREQQLAAVLRDHELLKKDYADLQSKKQEAALATTLEKEQAGQQFRVIDPPSVPTIPVSPQRLKISLGGIAGGIFLGLVLAFLAEARDHSFHSEKSVSLRFSMPIVVGIPLLLSSGERRLRVLKRVLECAGAIVLVAAVLIAEFYVYRQA